MFLYASDDIIQTNLYSIGYSKKDLVPLKEMVYMMQIIDTSEMDEISAFLTSTFIAHTYEVESTPAIVALWDRLRNNVKLKDELDYISAMLATGRIMDYRMEIEDLNTLNRIITDINTNIIGRKIESSDIQKELIYALITSSSISRSEKVENIRDIVDLWVQIMEGIEIKDDLDLIAAILTTGRIMELKIRAGGLDFINTIFLNLRKELEPRISGAQITKKELSAALLTSAYIEVSKKVEKIRDIADAWQRVCEDISVESQWDYISVILSTGKIRDMDAMHIEGHEGLRKINEKIREQIRTIVGE
jgi:hypothetical protein